MSKRTPSLSAAQLADHRKTVAAANAAARLRASAPELLAACDAAIAYDVAIQKYARNGRIDLRQDGSGIATGDDLDALYDAWVSAARAAIKKARGE